MNKKVNLIRSKVISGSMSPLIYKDDMIIVEPCDPAHIRIGDVVLFKTENSITIKIDGNDKKIRLVVHRIVDKKAKGGKEYFVQKGDSQLLGSPIEHRQIIGRVSLIKKTNYQIDLLKFRWKTVNFMLAIRAIFEYNFAILLNSLFWFLPKRIKYHAARELFAISRKLQGLLFKACIILLKDLYRKK